MSCVGDIKQRHSIFSTTIEKYGRLDILVSNAGLNVHVGQTMDCSENTWSKTFDINLKSTFLLCKEAVPLMKKTGGGSSIVFDSSISTNHPTNTPMGAYSISKTALLGLCKVASYELAADKIRVNCVIPGLNETKFNASVKHLRMRHRLNRRLATHLLRSR